MLRVCNAERSDAVDGVRHQFSRAGPDLGLCHAQLSQIRGRAVLDRLGACGGRRRGAGDAAIGIRCCRFLAAIVAILIIAIYALRAGASLLQLGGEISFVRFSPG